MKNVVSLVRDILSNTRYVIVVTLFFVFSGTFLFSYAQFLHYTPKALRQLNEEVRGYRVSSPIVDLPYVQGTKELGSTQTSSGKQLTLEVPRSVKDAQNYYNFILAEKNWVLEKMEEDQSMFFGRYRKNNYILTLSLSQEGALPATVVVINLTEK